MKYSERTEGVRAGREAAVTYLEPAELERLRELASEGDRSLAAELRRAVRSHLDANPKAAA